MRKSTIPLTVLPQTFSSLSLASTSASLDFSHVQQGDEDRDLLTDEPENHTKSFFVHQHQAGATMKEKLQIKNYAPNGPEGQLSAG